jgi:hypothetical protein
MDDTSARPPALPLFAVVSARAERGLLGTDLAAKITVASLCRSLFIGSIVVVHNGELPLFKVARRYVDEVTIPFVTDEVSDRDDYLLGAKLELMRALPRVLAPEPDQWVFVAESGGVATRNIDHLLPGEFAGPYQAPEIDFLWMEGSGKTGASLGFWAVRGEHLELVAGRFCSLFDEEPVQSLPRLWRQAIEELPLRKKRFEARQVAAPLVNAVDWDEVDSAAFVSVTHWPEPLRSRFLQALFFGVYLGDNTGMILNVLET